MGGAAGGQEREEVKNSERKSRSGAWDKQGVKTGEEGPKYCTEFSQ